jgi:hypothetical protein
MTSAVNKQRISGSTVAKGQAALLLNTRRQWHACCEHPKPWHGVMPCGLHVELSAKAFGMIPAEVSTHSAAACCTIKARGSPHTWQRCQKASFML